ncbi:MAG: TetR/AcrR family transcriptional regulator [Pseudomonadota bacterium]
MGTTARQYHHGDLKSALVDAGMAVIEDEGLSALTLRRCAAVAGVSHAAPRNHFGNLRGLLTAIAVVGFRRFVAALQDATPPGTPPAETLAELGHAYCAFATANPGLFCLMWDANKVDYADEGLASVTCEAFTLLESAVGKAVTGSPSATMSPALYHWSLIHGYTMLTLSGHLDWSMFSGANRYDPLHAPELALGDRRS